MVISGFIVRSLTVIFITVSDFMFDNIYLIINVKELAHGKNDEYIYLMDNLKKVADEISSEIRESSKIRNEKTTKTEQIDLFDKNGNSLNKKEVSETIVNDEKLDDEFEMLFDKLERVNEEKGLIDKIAEILIEELGEKKPKK